MLYAQTSSIKTETQTEKLLAVHFVIMQIPGVSFVLPLDFLSLYSLPMAVQTYFLVPNFCV